MKPYINPLLALLAFTGLCVGTVQAIRLYRPEVKDTKQPVVVTRIIDGDTLIIDSKTCRLAGIDAPEMEFKGRWPEQPSAQAARGYLLRNIEGKKLKARYGKPDKYGRQLVTLFLPDGADLNAELVKYGLAWPYGRTYASEHLHAKAGLWGLFADPLCIEPSRWRKGERAEVVHNEDDE